jgi:murein DD-endopeptidase MepM/ murein hydrolase activator NlpD
MRLQRWHLSWLAGLLMLFAAACSGAIQASGARGTPSPTSAADCPPSTADLEICLPAYLRPTASLVSPASPATPLGPQASDTPAGEASPTPPLLSESAPAPSPTPGQPSPTPCPPDLCNFAGVLFLQRPIAPSGNDQVDVTYRFGTTQGGTRDPHHGVEMLNPSGTPVLAAASGVVVVAGDDRQPTSPQGAWPITFYGPYSYFYGNLVVIQHEAPRAFPDLPQPVFTLYAHLSEISVSVGDQVQAGQQVGKVGMTGIATGSHLHFEVRLGENTYAASRNPELWLAPGTDANGNPMGALAASIIDSYGNTLELSDIVLEHLPNGPDQPDDLEIHLQTYQEKALVGMSPFFESFGAGDLPAGWYRINFPHFGARQVLVQVFPGQLTVTTIRVD